VVLGCSDDDRNKTTPDTALVETPAALSNEGHVRILFEARGNANGFVCTLDGQTAPCVSPFEADVADGEHAFSVAAALNGNVDESPAMHAWRVDTVAPDTTITSAPAVLDNSLAPELVFAGSESDVTFECALDGAAFTACSSPLTLSVLDGVHAFAVRAKDAAGNIDPTPAMHGWTVDATAPETMITAGPAAGATSGPSGSFSFSSPDSTATFECKLDAAAFAACTSPLAFTLGDGAHTFEVRAKDPSGIVDPSPPQRAWTVDAVGPPVTITQTPGDPSNATTPQFSFTSTDPTATFECQVDGVVAFAACTSPFTSPALTDGNKTFRVRATDPFANVGTPATFLWLVDTVAPTVSFSAVPAALSNDDTPSATFSTTDNPVTIECRVDMGNFAACTSPFTAAATADGLHTITVRATDLAGNPGSATTAMFEIDTMAPTAAFTMVPAALSNDTTPTVQFTTAGNPTLIQCRVDSGAFGTCTSGFSPTVGAGTHTISVRVTDAATNFSTITTAMFVVDLTPPTVTITGQPPALSNNNDPQVTFTHDGMSPTCAVDTGTPVACTSPHTFANVADGPHTITVRVVDAAGNPGSATTTSFTIDTVGPTLAFIEQAPAAWPVNYFDFTFSTGDSATVACSLDGAAFTACASGQTVTAAYNAAHTLQVRGTDAAGNPTTITSTAWTPVPGMVLHYPWEQGSTQNTSLLRQRASHSPNGPAAGLGTFVGGWAGSALGNTVAAHAYAKTTRALLSSPNGHYTGSFWIRAIDGASGTIFSTVGGTGGVRATLSGGTQITFQTFENGQSQQLTTAISVDRWVAISFRTTGPGKGLEIFVDGMSRGAIPTFSGFNAGQAADLTVGNWASFDLDDLRFYNVSFTNNEMCTLLARGFINGNGGCVPLSPGFEIDFEGRVVDTGLWNLPLSAPPAGSFVLPSHTLGQHLRLQTIVDWGYAVGGASFRANVNAIPARSFSFEFVPAAAFGRLIDMRTACDPQTGGGGLCGIMVAYPDNNQIQIYTGTPSQQKTTIVTEGLVPNRFNNVVVTEQRGAGGVTTSLTVFINNKATVIPVAGGDVFAVVRDDIRLVQTANLVVDEYEFWAADLSTSTELLCENGLDGEFDIVSNTCLLTYGP
jgi:hypothetical protein